LGIRAPSLLRLGQLEYQINNNTEHISVSKISGGNTSMALTTGSGVGSQYFAAVFIPDTPENLLAVTLNNPIELIPDPNKPNETRNAEVVGAAVGRPGTFTGRLFVGPKALPVLETVLVPTISGAAKDLRTMVNFGWFTIIARPLFIWLRWMNQFVHNWGWSIVLQTIVIHHRLAPPALLPVEVRAEDAAGAATDEGDPREVQEVQHARSAQAGDEQRDRRSL
jgi:YidC/Oxa1 family membrane protein insertase